MHRQKSPSRKQPNALKKMAAIAATRLGLNTVNNENRNSSNTNGEAAPSSKRLKVEANGAKSEKTALNLAKSDKTVDILKLKPSPNARPSPVGETNTTPIFEFDIGPPPGAVAISNDMSPNTAKSMLIYPQVEQVPSRDYSLQPISDDMVSDFPMDHPDVLADEIEDWSISWQMPNFGMNFSMADATIRKTIPLKKQNYPVILTNNIFGCSARYHQNIFTQIFQNL